MSGFWKKADRRWQNLSIAAMRFSFPPLYVGRLKWQRKTG